MGRSGNMSPKKLFGNHVEPACRHCRFGKDTSDGRMVLCEKAGVVSPFYSCRKYRYAPLKRVPSRQVQLPKFDKSDFEL